VKWIYLAQDRVQQQALCNMAAPYEVWSLTSWVTMSFSERNDLQGVNISTSRCLCIQHTYVNVKKYIFIDTGFEIPVGCAC